MKTKERTKERLKPERLPNIHPGRIIKSEVLEARGITQTDLAAATGLPVSRINDLVKERRGITVDSAIRLGKALGTTPELWLNLQRSYDLEEAMLAHQKDYDSLVPLPAA
jgi:addiction module HigA family antidote